MENGFTNSLDKTHRQASPSLVSSMLQIAAHYAVQARDLSSAQSLTFLSVRPPTANKTRCHSSKRVLYQTESPQFDRNFVAISYACDTPAHENGAAGGYYLVNTDVGGGKSSKVRDTVLDRVVSYLEHSRYSSFWIDQECIDQRVERTKQEAMQTMDVVYRRSRDSVGLLSVSIRRRRDIKLLLRLLQGQMTRTLGRHGAPQLMTDVGFHEARKLLGVLCHIAGDRWWSRRWIFQEEFCAGKQMRLMMSHTPELEDIKRADADIFGNIDGELCVNAFSFREQVTLFCIAGVRAHMFTSKRNRQRYMRVLRTLKRYNLLELLGRHIGDDSAGRPMSARLLEDVCRRGVTNPFDTLPILANCCGYATRLDVSRLECNNIHSLEIALLVLVVLNGDILRNDIPCKLTSLPDLLKRHSLNSIEPPSRRKRLTFMKRCRLVNVRLCREGILTAGHLWRVCGVLPIEDHPRVASCERSDWQRVLRRLADSLSVRYGHLARDIRNFFNQPSLHKTEALSLARIFVDTAAEIAMAVNHGRDIFVARTEHKSEAWGIFYRRRGSRQPRTPPRLIFTAHELADHHFGPIRNRFLDKYVSMEVTDVREVGHGIPRLKTGRWITGMSFSDTVVPQDVLFPWPAGLDQISPHKLTIAKRDVSGIDKT